MGALRLNLGVLVGVVAETGAAGGVAVGVAAASGAALDCGVDGGVRCTEATLGGLAMLLLSLLLLLRLPLGMDPTVGYDSIRYGTIRMDLGEAMQQVLYYIYADDNPVECRDGGNGSGLLFVFVYRCRSQTITIRSVSNRAVA
jgi:hypothetical protein